jgi:phosphoglycerate dehydrogenase-like enzyme
MAQEHRPTVAVLGFEPENEPAGDAGLRSIGDLADIRVATDADELAAALDGAPILLVLDFRAGVIRQAWPAARSLRWIHAASAGVDNLMFPELRDSPVVVTNARGVFDDAIAEWVLGVLLTFCKDLHTCRDLQRQAIWSHRESERLAGKRMLVVGAGGIGRAIGRLCKDGQHAG